MGVRSVFFQSCVDLGLARQLLLFFFLGVTVHAGLGLGHVLGEADPAGADSHLELVLVLAFDVQSHLMVLDQVEAGGLPTD